MKYGRYDAYHMQNHKIIWGCNFEPTSTKESKQYSCTPVKGMLTLHDDLKNEQDPNASRGGFYTTPRYFVPFKKNAKGCDLEDLAWSKAVNIRSRVYADTEDECIEAYNECVMKNVRHVIGLAKEYADNIINVNMTETDKTLLDTLKNV